MRIHPLFYFPALGALAISTTSHAQVVTAITPAKPPTLPSPPLLPAQLSTTPFSKLLYADQRLTLQGIKDHLSVSLPISNRAIVGNAKIHVEFTSSILLLDATSQISVIVNDNVLGTVPLHRLQPNGQLDAVVPDNLLRSGYNDIEIEVTQHYAPSCENPAAPELWTRINAEKSYVTYSLAPIPISTSLFSLDQTLDSELPGPFRINIVTGSTPTDDQLLQGAIVAEGIALRRPNCSLEVTQSFDVIAGVDNILVGTSGELSSTASAPLSPDSSFLQIQPGPDTSHFNLIVGGAMARGVTHAALAIASRTFALPDSSEAAITTSVVPDRPLILAGSSYHSMSEFGFKTATVKGSDAFQLEFDMAPECFARTSNQVELNLHFAYSAGLRRDSMANILVNGHVAGTIPLTNETGNVLHNYRVPLSIGAFDPGHNTLTIQPRLLPAVADYCAPPKDNLYMVLYQDSAILAPGSPAKSPSANLRLFSRSGFPFTTYGTSAPRKTFTVYLARTDTATTGAAWTLMAKLAQKTHHLVLPSQISMQLSHTPRPILAIGASDDLSSDLIAGTTARFGGEGFIGGDRSRLGQIKGNIPSGEAPLLTSFPSPFDSKSIVVLYTAGSPELLQTGLEALIQPPYWENLKGNTATWYDQPESLSTISY